MFEDDDRAYVRNASDPEQVKRAERRIRNQQALFLRALRVVLDTYEGRLLLWELVTRSGLFRSAYAPTDGPIYYVVGRQDFGRELMVDVANADAKNYAMMQHEARVRARRERSELDAAETPRAGEDPSG
jgi:hypothetical protein